MRIGSTVRFGALWLMLVAFMGLTAAAAAARSYDPLSGPRNGAGQPVDQHGIPLPGYSLGPT